MALGSNAIRSNPACHKAMIQFDPGSSVSTLEAHKRIIAHSIDLTIRNHQCGTDVLKESVHYSVSGSELIILLPILMPILIFVIRI